MNFLDAAFLFAFLPVTLIIFFGIGKWAGPAPARLWLAAASLVFCIPFGPYFMGVVILSLVVNYFVCRQFYHPDSGGRFALLLFAILFNLGILILFKYGAFFDWLFNDIGMNKALSGLIPITISFFTFQRLVFVMDSYNRKPEAKLLLGLSGGGSSGYLAFISAFPNLVIGPIVYASEVAGQLMRKSFGRVRRIDLHIGTALILIGLFKKLVIGDTLGSLIVDPIFAKVHLGAPVLAIEVFVAMIGYYAQLYFDFSGYSDIAIGIARLFGLRFPYNFNSPLRATGIVDFYKRWHITLTRIVARFMFQPLSIAGTRFAMRRNMRGLKMQFFASWLPLLINFHVIGIWHGANLTFVLFGVVHGLWFILETEARRSKPWKNWVKASKPWLRRLIGQAITFLPLMITFALFRSANLHDFGQLFVYLGQDWMQFFNRDQSHFILITSYPILAAAFGIIWLLPNAYEFLGRYRPGIQTFAVPSETPALFKFIWRPTLFWAAIAAVCGFIVLRQLGTPAPFVYGGF
jgi:alginate O-acetyltransferase complex protein AlgI